MEIVLAENTHFPYLNPMKCAISQPSDRWRRSGHRKPLILRGARQVGKTFSLREFGAASFPNHHYVNFEKDEGIGRLFEKDLRPDRIIDVLQFYFDRPIDRGRDLVIYR